MQAKQKVVKKEAPKKTKQPGKKPGPDGPKKLAPKFVGFSLRDQLMMLEDPDYQPA